MIAVRSDLDGDSLLVSKPLQDGGSVLGGEFAKLGYSLEAEAYLAGAIEGQYLDDLGLLTLEDGLVFPCTTG